MHDRQAFLVRGIGDNHRNFKGINDQSPGLEPLHPRHAAQIVGHADQVDHLAAGHALGAGRLGQQADQLAAHLRILVGVLVRQDFKRDGLQGVAGQYGGRFVIGAVHGQPSAADIVVVHARQVVVDQAIGVDAFQGAGRAQGRVFVGVEQARGFQREERTQALARPERRIAHGLGQARFRPLAARQQLVQSQGDQVGRLRQSLSEGRQVGIGGDGSLHLIQSSPEPGLRPHRSSTGRSFRPAGVPLPGGLRTRP